MTIKSIILPITLLFSIQLNGEEIPKSVPGYLGKKNLLSLTFKPGLDMASNEQIYYLKKPIIGFEFEHVLDRRGSFNAGIYYGKWDAKNGFEDFGKATLKINNFRIDYMSGNIVYSALQTYVSKSYYFKGRFGLAPLGKYFKMGLNLNLLKVNDNQMSYNVSYNSDNEKNKFVVSPRFHIELGSKRFFDKQLFFQHGLEFAIPFNFYRVKEENYKNPEDYNNALLPRYANSRQTITYKLALGFAF